MSRKTPDPDSPRFVDPVAAHLAVQCGETGLRGLPRTQVFARDVYPQPDPQGRLVAVNGLLVFQRSGRGLKLVLPDERRQLDEHDWTNLLWDFVADVAASRAGPVLISLQLSPNEPERTWHGARQFDGITPAVLRAVRPDLIVRLALERLKAEGDRWESLRRHYALAGRERSARTAQQQLKRVTVVNAVATARGEPGRKRGRKLDQDFYRDIAYRCLELYESGNTASITRRIATERHVERKTVEGWIRKARQLRFLAPGERGRTRYAPGTNLPAQHPTGRLTAGGRRDGPTSDGTDC